MKMKVCKIIVCLVVLGIALPVFSELPSEKNFDYKEGFMAYYATCGKPPSEEAYENYIIDYYPKIYNKHRHDEFAWRDSLSKIKEELNEEIKRYDISTNYWRWSTRELEDYDFERKGFPLEIRTGYLKNDELVTISSVGEYSSRLPFLELYIKNPGDFNFLPYSEEAARKFIQSRRNEYGHVDREVTIVVHFTLLPVKSEESRAVIQRATLPSGYCLVTRINKVEVYEDKDRTKKMGQLTKTPSK